MNLSLAIFVFLYGRANGWAWALVGVGCGIYLFYRGFVLLNRKRLIENIPASKIRSASMGLVEVSGLAVGPHTMPAPITGHPCFYYRTTAWQLKQSGNRKEWEKVANESLHLPFFIDDNTGKVLVDPDGAEMDIHRDFHEEYGTSLLSFSADVPPNVGAFLSRHGVTNNKKLKIEEYCIKPKNALFVLGTLAENSELRFASIASQSSPHFSNMANRTVPKTEGFGSLSGMAATNISSHSSIGQEVIRLSDHSHTPEPSAMTQQQRVAAALMKAGITNPAAWTVAGVGTGTTPPGSPSSAGSAAAVGVAVEEFDVHPPMILMKGTHNPAFFISWRSQRDVVQSLGWKSALMIWGGPALTLLSMYVLLAHFRLL
ncbi:MAG TPA: GIDE domain-containing protein [Terriglobales bacterium]|nr:GIDE domain-containing protein [Terriglobales bacterium]